MTRIGILERNELNLVWLIRLRWAEVVGQAATVLLAQLFWHPLPLAPLAWVIGVGAASNLVLAVQTRRFFRSEPRLVVKQWQIAFIMALDVLLLTMLLFFTGGPDNPFASLYVVQIALAAVALEEAWTWALVAFSFFGFGALLLQHHPLAISSDMRILGSWGALGVASAFIVHFVRRLHSAVASRDAELTRSRQLAARQERVAGLATVAAGAAHELATPLSTVALVAKELERSLDKLGNPALVEDARLIRDQVARCRMILDQMAGGASTAGELVETRMVATLAREAVEGIRLRPPVRLQLDAVAETTEMRVPPRALGQALRSLVTNAQDASPPEQEVEVTATVVGEQVVFEIIDHGVGMPQDILARVGEPFFTTKAPGQGMGLGLFLAHTVVHSLGGSLTFHSVAGQGTRARLEVPRRIASATRVASSTDPFSVQPSH